MKNSNKRPIESFVVAKVGQTSMPTSGTLSNSSTGAINLNDGQLGVVSASIFGSVALNSFTNATPTVATAPVIKIVNGTAQSANPAVASTYPLWVRPFESTSPIDGRGNVIVTKQAYREPGHSVWVIGNTVGETGAVNVLESTLYQIAIAFRGNRVDSMVGNNNGSYLRAKVETPDFSDLSMDTAEATDYILSYLGWEINRNSQQFAVNSRFPGKSPVVAFLIDTTGTDGTAIGGGDPIVAGDVISVLNSTAGLRNITLTEAMATSIKNAALAVAGGVIADLTWNILTIDLANAGSATGGLGDVLMLVALDEPTAHIDYIPQVKVSLEVTLPSGFNYNTVRYTHANRADEGQGLARQLDLEYKATQGQRKYFGSHEEFPIIEFPSPIVANEKYVVYNILHENVNQVDTFNRVDSPFRDIVCIPAYSSGTTANGLIATFDGYVNSFLGSTVHNNTIITLN